jgi:hypothetical protein
VIFGPNYYRITLLLKKEDKTIFGGKIRFRANMHFANKMELLNLVLTKI